MGNYVFISIYILPLLSEVFIKSSECCEALQFLNHAVPPPQPPFYLAAAGINIQQYRELWWFIAWKGLF